MGGAYHVYCRIARGGRPLADASNAAHLLEIIAKVKTEHGLTILAWCIMPNHYHLVVRAGHLSLWRSMRLIQGRFAKAHNRREHLLGPVWQSRYKSRLIEDTRYLRQAIAYVHLNAVTSGLADEPASYRWSGHRQMMGRTRQGLMDIDEALLVFDTTRQAARRTYEDHLSQVEDSGWTSEGVGGPPKWPWGNDADDELRDDPTRPTMDWLGIEKQVEPPSLSASELAKAVAEGLGLDAEVVAGRRRGTELKQARQMVMLLGVEMCELKVKELAEVVGRSAGSASRLYGHAVARRRDDPTFADTALVMAERIRERGPEGSPGADNDPT